jgi:antitoxin MazE
MTAKAQMCRWGNSLAIRIPRYIADEAGLHEGTTVVLDVASQGEVAIEAIERPPAIDELVAKITPENLHGEECWGEPVGPRLGRRLGSERWRSYLG